MYNDELVTLMTNRMGLEEQQLEAAERVFVEDCVQTFLLGREYGPRSSTDEAVRRIPVIRKVIGFVAEEVGGPLQLLKKIERRCRENHPWAVGSHMCWFDTLEFVAHVVARDIRWHEKVLFLVHLSCPPKRVGKKCWKHSCARVRKALSDPSF